MRPGGGKPNRGRRRSGASGGGPGRRKAREDSASGSRPEGSRPEGARQGARPGGASEEAELKHEVARDSGGTIHNARAIEREAGSDPEHPAAAPAIAASDGGGLYCCVCGSPLRRVFGSSGTRRWHFALREAEASACGHEPETEAHRAAKVALHERLEECMEESLAGQGWQAHLEKALENGRRPDVLAVNSVSGERVAFEVQYADMSREQLAARRRDYASLSVADLWLLGHHRLEKSRDLLARELAAAGDQRLIYISDTEVTEVLSALSGSSPWGSWSLEEVDSRHRRRALAHPARRDIPGKKDTKGRGTPLCSAVVEPLSGVRLLSGAGGYESASGEVHASLRDSYRDAERLQRIGTEAIRYHRALQAREHDAAAAARGRLLDLLKADRDACLARGLPEPVRAAPEAVRKELLSQREADLAVFASALRWKSAVYALLAEGVSERLAADRVLASVDHRKDAGLRAAREAARCLAALVREDSGGNRGENRSMSP